MLKAKNDLLHMTFDRKADIHFSLNSKLCSSDILLRIENLEITPLPFHKYLCPLSVSLCYIFLAVFDNSTYISTIVHAASSVLENLTNCYPDLLTTPSTYHYHYLQVSEPTRSVCRARAEKSFSLKSQYRLSQQVPQPSLIFI